MRLDILSPFGKTALILLFVFLTKPVLGQGIVKVDGLNVTVSAVIRLDGDVTPQIRDAVRRVLSTRYNEVSFLYKCYTVRFEIGLHGDGARTDLEEFSLDVIDVSSTQARRDAFEFGALYDQNDWAEYDRQTGNMNAAQCSSFDSGYNTDCAYQSAWFDNNTDRGKKPVNGYIEYHTERWGVNWGADYDGRIDVKDGVISTEANDRTIGHEIGHMFGFKHTNSAYDLMYETANDTKETIIFANIYQMLRGMELECRWELSYPQPVFSITPQYSCNKDCISVTSGEWEHRIKIKSNGQELSGKGELSYKTLQTQGCGFATSSQPGTFAVTGKLIDSLDRGKVNEDGVDLGYLLELSSDFSTLPHEIVGPSTLTIAQGFFTLGGGKKVQLSMKGPDATSIDNPPRLSYNNNRIIPPCLALKHQMISEPIKITKVEPFKGNILQKAGRDCLAYTSEAATDRTCK